MDPRTKRAVVSGLLLASLVVASFFILQFVGGQQEPQLGDDQEAPRDPGNLLVPGRTHLSLCVDTAGGGSITGAELDRVSSAVDSALGSLDRIYPEFGQPSVTAGCPPAIPLTGERVGHVDLCCTFSKRVSDNSLLSPHRVFIYFVPDDAYVASFGNVPFANAAAEYLCHGDACGEKTVSLYVPASAGSEVMSEAVLYGLALQRTQPGPTFDPQGFFQSCQQGTPVSGCDRYFLCLTPTPVESCDSFWREMGVEPPR